MEWISSTNGRVTGSDECLHQCVNCPQLYWIAWDTCPACGTSKYVKPKAKSEKKDDGTNQTR